MHIKATKLKLKKNKIMNDDIKKALANIIKQIL
jgi:hypothetical protein